MPYCLAQSATLTPSLTFLNISSFISIAIGGYFGIVFWVKLKPTKLKKECPVFGVPANSPKKHKDKKAKRALIPNRISIVKRPAGATNRSRYGHYEGDTIVSGKWTGSKAALSVAYERKAKHVSIRKIKNLRPASHNRALHQMFKNQKVLSLTQDNGIENTHHGELGVKTFFCDPYSSWQKGGVENVNRMIRRFIAKGSDINDYSDDYVMMVEGILNNKPRKSLGYKTPNEVMRKNNRFTNPNLEKIALQG